jgi:hypothetical protein
MVTHMPRPTAIWYIFGWCWLMCSHGTTSRCNVDWCAHMVRLLAAMVIDVLTWCDWWLQCWTMCSHCTTYGCNGDRSAHMVVYMIWLMAVWYIYLCGVGSCAHLVRRMLQGWLMCSYGMNYGSHGTTYGCMVLVYTQWWISLDGWNREWHDLRPHGVNTYGHILSCRSRQSMILQC